MARPGLEPGHSESDDSHAFPSVRTVPDLDASDGCGGTTGGTAARARHLPDQSVTTGSQSLHWPPAVPTLIHVGIVSPTTTSPGATWTSKPCQA